MTSATTPGQLATARGYAPTPPTWPVSDRTPTPMTLFGKDHWSTFAYVETRAVDYAGLLCHDHMRCHPGRHPLMMRAKLRVSATAGDGSAYPTRLKHPDGTYRSVDLPEHDDYDCLDDLIAAGLLHPLMPVPHEPRWSVDAVWTLTAEGRRVAGELRAHKASGGAHHSFTPTTGGDHE